jgi:hypothetical protein
MSLPRAPQPTEGEPTARPRPASSNERFLAYAVCLTYAVAGVLLATRHAIWRDEGQAWLIARDAPTIWALFDQLGYEGSPGLWHLLLRPMARAGLPVLSMSLLNVALTTAAVAVLCFRSPYRAHEKPLIAFGCLPFALYGVVARSYGLTLLLLYASASLYPSRRERPWAYAVTLGLLANTNVHSAIMAAALGTVLAWDLLGPGARGPLRVRALPLAAWLAGLAVAVLQVLPPADLAPHLRSWHAPNLGGEWRQFLPLLGGLLLLGSPRALASYLAAGGGIVLIFLTKYPGQPWHCGLLYLLFVTCVWMAERDRPRREFPVRWIPTLYSAVLLGVLVRWFVPMPSAVRAEWTVPYSAGREVAALLESADPEQRELLVIYPSYLGASVLPYRPAGRAQAYYLEYGAMGSFTTWNTALSQAGGLGRHAADVAAGASEAARLMGSETALLVIGYPGTLPEPEREGRPPVGDAEMLGDFAPARAPNECMVVYRVQAAPAGGGRLKPR